MTGATGAINLQKGRGIAKSAETKQIFRDLLICSKRIARPWKIAFAVSNLCWCIGAVAAIIANECRRKNNTCNAFGYVSKARGRIRKSI